MSTRNLLISAGASLFFVAGQAAAQDIELDSLQRNINIFSGILEEALELDQSAGLFGLSLGGIENTYLLGQGVVFEVRTPLANRRNRMSLASLNSAMQSLQNRNNPFERMRTPTMPANPQPILPDTVNLERANNYYREMMDKISNIDYSLVVSTAIQQASDSARSLRSLGNVDESAFEAMRDEIEELRVSMQRNLSQLRELELEIRDSSSADDAAAATESSENEMQAKLDALLASIEPLRELALAKAQELQERTEVAEQAYAERWQQDLEEFELDLYQALCSYGSSLHELPDGENISLVLTGLGEESADNPRRTDKIHIVSLAAMLQCQAGEIDATTLQQQSAQYSY